MHAPNRSRLPPLNALRGFEAAARLASFAKAAEELSLTQSAVSHQVRQLEAALGQRLLKRLPRELVLTDAGRDFLETVRQALDLLNVGVARLAPYQSMASLIVSCDAAFARFWLSPRLARFRASRPDIDIWLDTSERLLDFDRQEVEVVIGRLRSSGTERIEETLFEDRLGPCYRPAAADKSLTVEDLGHLRLVHDERRDNWLVWLKAIGASSVDAAAGPRYSDPGLAIDAARAGDGIALVSDVLALDELESGALIAPFRDWLVIDAEYRIAHPRWLAEDDALTAFLAFVRSEAVECRERLARRRAGARLLAPAAPDAGTTRVQ